MSELADQTLTELGPRGTTYLGCTLDGVAEEAADLRGSTFEDCRFVRCTLRNAVLADARFVDCTFVACDLMGTDWTTVRWGQFDLAAPLAFGESRLDYAGFHAVALRDAAFYACSLVEADLEDAVLVDADLRHADLTGTRFTGADLSGADLTGATGYALHPERTRLTGTKVSLPEGAALLHALGMTVAPAADRLDAEEWLARRP